VEMLADLANLDLERCDGAERGRSMLAFGTVQQSNHCAREEFLYELKAGPAGGRLRRPPSARQGPSARHSPQILSRDKPVAFV
jgi:hypothetical protein